MDSDSDDEVRASNKTPEDLEPEESNRRIDVLLRVITLLIKKNTPEPQVVAQRPQTTLEKIRDIEALYHNSDDSDSNSD
jgi:hypothetical protein